MCTVFGKIPYYEGINIKSATPTKLFTNKVIVIQSWSITKGKPYKERDWSTTDNASYYHDKVLLYFHGAKNTYYNFYLLNSSDATHSSFGLPSDYAYYYGIGIFSSKLNRGEYGGLYISTYLNVLRISDLEYFNNKIFSFTTDNNGNFTFLQSNCPTRGHYSNLTLYFYLNGYPNHQLIFHNLLPNTN